MPFPRTRKIKLIKHVVGVPNSSGELTQCVVLWESRYWKSIILLGITDLTVDAMETTTEIGPFVSVIYTSAAMIRCGDWKLQGTIDIDIPEELNTYESAGVKYIGDERIGPLGDEKLALEVGCAGMEYVRGYIEYLLYNGEAPFGYVRTYNRTAKFVERVLKPNRPLRSPDQGDG